MDNEGSLFGYLWSAMLSVAGLIFGLLHAGHRREMEEVKAMAKQANAAAEENARSLAAHKLHAAETFATQADMEKLGDRIEARFDKLEAKLEEKERAN